MKVIILAVSNTVSDETLVNFIQDLSNEIGEGIQLTILGEDQLIPKPIERPASQQLIEDIIEVCDTNDNDEIRFSTNFWNQIHIGRITRETINEIVKNAEKYPKYLQSKRKATLVLNLCKIAAGVLN